jgi:MYXO-CTERM domain-containing protein
MILGLATGQLAGGISPISLPSLAGLNIKPVAVTSTDPDGNGVHQFLSIFANVAATTPIELPAETSARLVELVLPTTAEFAVDSRSDKTPSAVVALSGDGPGPLEWSHRLDGGFWSPYSSEPRLTLTDPLLRLQGRHALEVRARVVDQPGTRDPSPATVELLVDTVAPKGHAILDGDHVLVAASDAVSPPERLRYRLVDPSRTGDWAAGDTLALGSFATQAVQAQAVDEAGNIGTLEFHGRTSTPPTSGCGSCSATSSSPSEALLVAAFVLVWLLRRRALLLLLALGCNHQIQKGDLVSPNDRVGLYLDAQVAGDSLHLAAYDETVGDLVYAQLHSVNDTIQWLDVDGIDTSEPGDTPGDYRHGYSVNQPGPDVGQYASLRVGSDGNARIAYYDASAHALKYAKGPYPFAVHQVASTEMGDAGRYAAMSLDASGKPSIAFLVTGLGDGTHFTSELRLATAHSADPSSAADWDVTTVDSTKISCAGLCAGSTVCIMPAMVNGKPNGDPSLSTCVQPDSNCPSGCKIGQACIAGACANPLVAPSVREFPEGVGLFTQALRTSSGSLALVYHDRSQGDLKAAVGSPGAFMVTLVDGGNAQTDVGQFASAAIASDDTLHIAYVDAISDRLLYKTVQSGTPMAAPEVIDDGVRQGEQVPVGAGAALALDGDHVRVVYQDQAAADLEHAVRTTNWTQSPLESGPTAYGFWPHLVSWTGALYVVEAVIDRQATPIYAVKIDVLP